MRETQAVESVSRVMRHPCTSYYKKEGEKILKYQDLITEIQCMWNVKAKVIPVITGVTGTVSKSLRQYLSNIPEKHEIKEIKKTAIFVTVHILQKVLIKSTKHISWAK
jgi:hypothetical protein